LSRFLINRAGKTPISLGKWNKSTVPQPCKAGTKKGRKETLIFLIGGLKKIFRNPEPVNSSKNFPKNGCWEIFSQANLIDACAVDRTRNPKYHFIAPISKPTLSTNFFIEPKNFAL
jgi:hypothetical protein